MMSDFGNLYYGVTWAVCLFLLNKTYQAFALQHKLAAIPTLGQSGLFGSWLTALKFIKHGRDMIQEGYVKYPGRVFKIAMMDRWVVVVAGSQKVLDIRKAPEGQLSFQESASELLQLDYVLGRDEHRFHVPVIRGPLTRNISSCYEDIRDEISAAWEDIVPVSDDWTSITAVPAITQVVARTSNRLFLGLPSCRDAAYLELVIGFAQDVMSTGYILLMIPPIFKRLVAPFTPLARRMKAGIKLMTPLLTERLENHKAHGKDLPNRPNDLISWLLDEAPEDMLSVGELTRRILLTNFAAIHTTTFAFSHALFLLAAHPEIVRPLREEIEDILGKDHWSKPAVDKMQRLDSFLKEAQRLYGTGSMSLTRKTMADFTFSDGEKVPAGVMIAIPGFQLHRDETNYEAPEEFKPFRFYDMKTNLQGTGSEKYNMVTASPDFLLFGMGRTTCPGRFFAVNELKTMMAHVLMNYDIKLEADQIEHPHMWFNQYIIPDTHAKVLFKRRE